MAQDYSRKTVFLHWLFALLAGVACGAVIQALVNLAHLEAIGAMIYPQVKFSAVLHDLIYFSPFMAVLLAPSLALSQWVALKLVKRTKGRWLVPLCALGGYIGLWFAVMVLDMLAPTPGLIYATISAKSALMFYAAGALAGAAFGCLRKHRFFARGTSMPTAGGSTAARLLPFVLSVAALLLPAKHVHAEAGFDIQPVASGLDKPWSLAFLPDGRLLVTEKPGRLRVIEGGKLLDSPVSGVPEVLYAGQGGLFEVLPAQDFAQSQQIYLSYACGSRGANGTCVARGKLDGLSLTDVQQIFKTDFSKVGGAHFGGRMVWLPDGTLVLTLGDGYSYRDDAQNLSNQFGTLVRINADGSVPKDNPFVSKAGANPAIYSYGHRSVQGLVYDAETGRLYEHEHGARGGDEINIIEPGKNYGWPLATYGIDYSGAKITPYTAYDGTEQPLVYWVPSIAPSGMAMYRGDLFPQWKGSLLVGALAGRHVRLVELKDGKVTGQKTLFSELGERIRDVRMGPEGALYLLTDSSDGRLLRVVPK